LVPIVNMDSSCFMLMYVIVCVALITMRWTEPNRFRPYSVPGGTATALIAGLASLFMLLDSFYLPYAASKDRIPLEWTFFIGWAMLGMLFWAVSPGRRDVSDAERRMLIMGERSIPRSSDTTSSVHAESR